MHDDKKLTNATSLALIFATLALGWFKFGDLTLPANSLSRSETEFVSTEETITARLWEDPLNAVLAGKPKGEDPAKHLPANLQEMIERSLGGENNVQTTACLMVVPVPGAPFPDDVETRLRVRYSVQMALADKHFSPDNHGHLGYVNLPSNGKDQVHAILSPKGAKTSEAAGVDVPYEWFSSSRKQSGGPTLRTKILVLWLPEEWLGNQPLCRLATLRFLLTPESYAALVKGPFIIGPRSSDALKGIVQGRVEGHPCKEILRDNLRIFSCEATAPDSLLRDEPSADPTCRWLNARKGIKADLLQTFGTNKNWSYFENFITPDDQLTDLLVKELHLRRAIPDPIPEASKQKAQSSTNGCPKASQEKDTVLILSEADTSYGRSLPLAFRASLKSFTTQEVFFDAKCCISDCTPAERPDDSKGKGQSSIRIARYLKGLDTQKGSQKKDSSDEKRDENSAGQLLADTMKRKSAYASGESQLDYAERLADQLHAELEKGTSHKKVKAVGILGGDIYDKLILLRTLRPRFKEALFFTTDLDARLWQPEHLKFTHNLVVASAYNVNDVNVHDKDSDRPPPFRDVYQVAVFYACRTAIEFAAGDEKQQQPEPRSVTPGVYEIGKTGPIELPLRGLPQSPSLKAAAKCEDAQPAHTLEAAENRQACLAGICLSFLIAMLAASGLKGLDAWIQRKGGKLEKISGSRRRSKLDESRHLKRLFPWMTIHVIPVILFTFMIGIWFALHFYVGLDGPTTYGGALFSIAIWFCLMIFSRRDARTQGIETPDDEELKFHHLFDKQTGWAGWFLCGTLLIEVLLTLSIQRLASQPDNEPWLWNEGVSIWPTELVRVLVILSIAWMLTWAWKRAIRLYHKLGNKYRLNSQLKQTPAISGTFFERLFIPWPEKHGRNSKVSAQKVFQCYRFKAGFHPRCIRVVIGALIYFLFMFGIFLLAGFPINTNIRGEWAHKIDIGILTTSVFCWLVLVFFVLDSVYLAAQLLKGLVGRETDWPPELLNEHEKKLGVKLTDLEGYLDVMFAADKTRELKVVVLLPFLIQFLMLAARNEYFDDWSWPPALVFVFVCNILLSAIAWIILRHAATTLKTEALTALGENLLQVELVADPKRKAGLLEIKRRIEEQNEGAYARWFQDPAFLAMLVPTGLFGVLSVLFRALFGSV